jgi:hypothetical protein
VLTYYYEIDQDKYLDAAVKLEVKFERARLGFFKVKPKVIKEQFIETK